MSSVNNNNLSKSLNYINSILTTTTTTSSSLSTIITTTNGNKSPANYINKLSTTPITTQQQQQQSSITTRSSNNNNFINGNEFNITTPVMVTRSPIKLINSTNITLPGGVGNIVNNNNATNANATTSIQLSSNNDDNNDATINVNTGTAGVPVTTTSIIINPISETITTTTGNDINSNSIGGSNSNINSNNNNNSNIINNSNNTIIPGGSLNNNSSTTTTTPTTPTTINNSSIIGGINTNNNNSHINNNHNTNRNNNNNYPHPHSSSTFSLNKNEEFHFIKPTECPVFKPNEEEFKNPLAYIGKIRPFAEKYGIAKIQPPKSWTPPFTVDVDKLKFTPRVQRLNELEAKTRVKLNFLDQIAKFWELQGSSLKIPMVERKALDLYSLHRIVQEEGGIEQTTKERKWSRIAHRMGYPSGKSIGAILKGHYERILHPFDIFTSGKAIDIKLETEIDDQDYKPHGIVSRQQISPPNETTARRSKRFANSNASKESACGLGSSYPGGVAAAAAAATAAAASAAAANSHIKEEKDDIYYSSEYKQRISSCGTGIVGQKMASGGHCGRMNRSRMAAGGGLQQQQQHQLIKKKQKDIDPLAKYICHICNRGDSEENMLLCDGCDDSYHTFCLIPPLNDIPKGDWRCPKCVVEEVNKPTEAFGFEQAQREYTLQQFGEMADQFKADYFNMSVHLVPTDLVEREFWRIVSSIDEDVTVEYGADLHTMDHGSGFPTKSSLYLLPGDQEYAESSWNLNNLPLLEESILGHINADISGMKVPWMYVGMCFATFCWHNEDHWSYSINYLHWGEPKTWYGVPGCNAEQFEETMKMAAPELFQSQPDLLHQLVTIMNPNILMNNNVPVYRTDQHAGEFVITFPRAYHAGFNQGYNFAEAVNFAPADWMKMGRECINHYSMLRRFCVFSHDELVCKMALEPDKLNLGIATACYLDMAEMVDTEKKLRKSLLEWGVTKADREAFELIPDDERQCDSCKTTCFLSAVTCICTKNLVCLRHYTELCNCIPDKHTLKYRYTLDELPLMLKKLKIKAESFENWLSKVRDVLDPTTQTTITLNELKNLTKEANDLKFPSSIILERLNSAVLEAEKCVTVIQQLDINKMRTRTRNFIDSSKYKLTMDELDLFVQEINNLCCIIYEGQSVRELQKLGKEFINNSKLILQQKINKINELKLIQLIDDGQSLCIELNEIKLLKLRLEQVNWYNRCIELNNSNNNNNNNNNSNNNNKKYNKIQLNDFKLLLKEGLTITPDTIIEKELINLQEIISSIEDWEEVAKKCFESGTQHELPEIELLLERANDINGELPSEPALRDAVKKAKEWLNTVDILQSNENYPYFHTLENVVNRGKNIPFQLEELKRMEEHLDSAKLWKEKTSKTFLKKQTQFHLMDVLSPRSDSVMLGSNINKKKLILEEQFNEDMGPVQMVNQFKNAEEKEMLDMRNLRKLNINKIPLNDKYCICKRKFNGYMYNCQLCKDWFHENCIPLPKTALRSSRISQNQQQQQSSLLQQQQNLNDNIRLTSTTSIITTSSILPQLNVRERDLEIKYLCPSCMRSRRPRLETILSLLVSLQRLPIRLPEGEALQCLTERAMNWQDRARTAFATKDIASALATLSLISQKNNDKDLNIIKTISSSTTSSSNQQSLDLKKKIRNNNNNNKRRSQIKTSEDDDDIVTSSDEEFRPLHIHEDDDIQSDTISAPPSPMKIEHAYSVLTPCSGGGTSTIPIKKNDINIIDTNSITTTDLPLIQLSKNTREFLEDLMMEGDLLEVSLDETLHIWRILNAAKPAISDLAHIQYKYNIVCNSNDVTINNTKKRRSDDHSTVIPTKKTTKVNNAIPNSTTISTITTTTTQNQQTPPTAKIKRGRKMKIVTKETDNTDTLLIQELSSLSSVVQINNNTINNIPISDLTSSTINSSIINNADTLIGSSSSSIIQQQRNNINSAGVQQIISTTISPLITTGSSSTTTITTTATTTTTTGGGVGKKRKRGTAGNKKLNTSNNNSTTTTQTHQEQITIVATAASTSDDDEECSAPNCARPSGREVDWVQCDGGCNKWFHMFCVGLDKNQIKPDDDYICKRCTKKSNISNNKQQSTILIQQQQQQKLINNSSTELNSNNDLILLNDKLSSSTITTTTTAIHDDLLDDLNNVKNSNTIITAATIDHNLTDDDDDDDDDDNNIKTSNNDEKINNNKKYN